MDKAKTDRPGGQDNNITTDTNTTRQRKYNIQNLKPFNPNYNNHLTTEEAQKRGRNGGKKSGEVRRARRTMRENLLDLLAQEIAPEKLAEMGADIDSMGGDYTLQNAVLASMVREAINGSERATALIRDTIGEQPTIKQEITETITGDDISMINNLKNSLIG